jgi:hypothetical protein
MDPDNFSIETAINSSFNSNQTAVSLNLYELYAIVLPSISVLKLFCIPIWLVLGIPGNVLAFIVWIRPSMRASSGCILAALAINDLIFLLLRLLVELQETWHYTVVEV